MSEDKNSTGKVLTQALMRDLKSKKRERKMAEMTVMSVSLMFIIGSFAMISMFVSAAVRVFRWGFGL